MHTNVEDEILKSKATVTVISLTEEKYVYKLISKDNLQYILKGYKIPMSPLDDINSAESYTEVLRQLGLVYQEFYLAKIDSAFTPHYVKPLHLATSFDPPQGAGEDGTVYAEILFEYGGESLDSYRKKAATKIKQIYNWMRQSANALCFLHGAGISHLDIKPANMVYDEEKDLLKIIDMGSSTSYTSQSQMFSSTKSVTSKIRELTVYYAPPEILQAYNNKALLASPISDPLEFIVGNIDVYCWAMCFYTLILRKKDKELENEITKFKLGKSDQYEGFLINMKELFEKLPIKEEEDIKLKNFIYEILTSSLQYSAKDRPKLESIVEKMKNFDTKEKVVLKYHEIEKIAQDKMNKMLGLHLFIKQQEEKISNLLSEAAKKQEEYSKIELDSKKIKEEMYELEKNKTNILKELEEKTRELNPLIEKTKTTKEKYQLEQENSDLKKSLDLANSKIQQLEQELNKQKILNAGLFKKCEAYTELQIKYSTDTMQLSKEKEKLAKELEELHNAKKVFFFIRFTPKNRQY